MPLCAVLLAQGVTAQTSLQPASAPAVPAVAPLTADQLDTLVAPIALYPDALVAQVLAAASYPDEVAFADDWLAQNQTLTGSALTDQVNQQSWDPSVKALTQFPSVLHDLAKNLSWTSSLGQAFTNQQSDVLAAVQVMRAKAQAAARSNLHRRSRWCNRARKRSSLNQQTVASFMSRNTIRQSSTARPSLCPRIRHLWRSQPAFPLARAWQLAQHSAAAVLLVEASAAELPGVLVHGDVTGEAAVGAETSTTTTTPTSTEPSSTETATTIITTGTGTTITATETTGTTTTPTTGTTDSGRANPMEGATEITD